MAVSTSDSFDLVVRGGRLITAGAEGFADVGVRGGRVVAIADRLDDATEVIDAAGLLVLPGGVDAHCHMDQPEYEGTRNCDDYFTGTRSALCGGTTTVMTFTYQVKGRPIREALADTLRRAAGRAAADYVPHLVVSDPSAAVLGQELPALISSGFTSLKLFLTYDSLKVSDREILETLTVAKRGGALVMVHAENDASINWSTEQLKLAGRHGIENFADSRPGIAEREATHRALALAELAGAPIYIAHVSTAGALGEISRARARGLPVYGETCPQYLLLTRQDLDRPGFEAAKFMCCPPPRDRASQDALWHGLTSGTLQVASSDHAPLLFDGANGKQANGPQAFFDRIPAGVPGIETRLPLLFSEGVNRGRMDLQRFVALTSTDPARLFGVFPKKGTIAIGSDADITIWDPGSQATIRNDRLHHACDYTPYEGRPITGMPVTTIMRGKTVWLDGIFSGEPGHGELLAAAMSSAYRNCRA